MLKRLSLCEVAGDGVGGGERSSLCSEIENAQTRRETVRPSEGFVARPSAVATFSGALTDIRKEGEKRREKPANGCSWSPPWLPE